MKPGIYATISNEDYHGGEGVSNSMLKLLHEKTPFHLKASRDAANDNNRPDTKAFFMGRELHSLVLEPELFFKDYCLAFRQQDMPEAIDDKQVLIDMVEALNATRLPKLSTSGSKAEQIARIMEVEADLPETLRTPASELEAMKGAELKAGIETMNAGRQGLLSTGGSRHDLAELLRANGKPVTLWSDVKAEWEIHNGHRRILTPEQWDQVHRMRDAVMAHPSARSLLTGSKYVTEHSAYANDPETGELRRVRPDLWRMDGIVGDLKTTEDASPEGFARSIAKYGYDVQHPYYLDTLNLALKQSGSDEFAKHPASANAFVFIVVEKSFPHAVEVYTLDDLSEAIGRAKYRKSLDTYAECKRTGVWPGYSDGSVQVISLPQWHMKQNEHLVGAA